MSNATPSSQKKYFLSAAEVARLFGVSSKTICRWIDDKTIPGYRLPGKRQTRRVLIKKLVEFCQANPQYKFVLDQYTKEFFNERRAIAERAAKSSGTEGRETGESGAAQAGN